MTEIKVNVDEVTAWLQVAQTAPELTEHEALTAMKVAVGMVDRQVVPRTPVGATGNLRSAWNTKVDRGLTAVKGEIYNPLVYAIVVEKGRKASEKQPPIWPLVYWFRRKHGMPMDEAISAAWGLAVNLTRRDIKAKKMLEKGFEAAEPNVKRLFNRIPETVFKKLK